MERVFSASFLLVFPFWIAMIAAPRWRVTRKVMGSPAVVLGAAALYAWLVLPVLGTVLPVVARPTLATVMALLNQPAAATAAWAHFLAFDLFVGRWIYLDALDRKLPWLAVAPTLVMTLLLGPLGLASYLLLRRVAWSRLLRLGRELAVANGPLTGIGVASLGLLAASLFLQTVDHRVVLGVSTWMKPAKFAASVAIATFTLAWIFRQLDGQARGLRRAARIIASMAALELAIITVQAARGVPSHFNARTPADVLAFAVMGAGITIFWLAQGYVFVRALRYKFADAAMGWGIRWGLGIALAGGAVAFLMTRPTPTQVSALKAGQPAALVGAHAVGVPDGGPAVTLPAHHDGVSAEARTERVQRYCSVGVLMRVDADNDLGGLLRLMHGGSPLQVNVAPAAGRSDRTVTGPRPQAPIRSRPARPAGAAREADTSTP